MARSIMGVSAETPQSVPDAQSGGAESEVLSKLGALFRGGAAQPSRQMAALEALKPCLDERRRAKLEKAMGLARAARIARLGLLGTEGENV